MAKLLQGLLGASTGKVGGIVTANWKGINYARGYAIPANPNSAAQQTERGMFAAIVATAKLILSTVIQPYWDPFQTGQSGFNGFMSANRNAWTNATDYANAIISQGALEPETIDACTYNTGTGAVELDWSQAGLGDGEDTDDAVCVIIDTGNNIAFVSDGAVARNAEQDAFSIGAGRTVADLKAYLFFYRGSGETLYVSNSDYFQVTAP